MTNDLLISQITAQIPEMPAYQASAFLLEFLESLRTEGRQGTVSLTAFDNQGYSAVLPEKMTRIDAVYMNGIEMTVPMSEAEARYILANYPDDYLTDDSGTTLTNDYGIPLEV
ncbi:MAG TPA: hypothetical protein PL124_11165 [Candidatus Cloacimonadota bacterium]|nr:hypothetical protein [Candidatus Cloacimonadota bacterium]